MYLYNKFTKYFYKECSYVIPKYHSSQILIIIASLLIQVIPIKELNSQDREENVQSLQYQEKLNFEKIPKWQKLKTNEDSLEKSIIWKKIEIENNEKPNHFLSSNEKDQLVENNNLKNSFRSSSRNLIYKGYLYPEMSFWIPSSFKHSKRFKYTFTGQILGNPTNKQAKDYCNWKEFWEQCSDTQYFFEATPVITKYFSLGLNYSQQESFLRGNKTWQEGGQSLGFQIKTNLNSTQGVSIIGNNLYNIYGGGGPNLKYPERGEKITADLGRSYLFLYSKAWDLGNHFNSESPSLINLNLGLGNGRYKSAEEIEKKWVNLGKYEPIFSLALALNKKISFFTEYAGQYSGVGISVRPFELPLSATVMLRDFQGSQQGLINCKNGNPENCRATIDSRLVFHF